MGPCNTFPKLHYGASYRDNSSRSSWISFPFFLYLYPQPKEDPTIWLITWQKLWFITCKEWCHVCASSHFYYVLGQMVGPTLFKPIHEDLNIKGMREFITRRGSGHVICRLHHIMDVLFDLKLGLLRLVESWRVGSSVNTPNCPTPSFNEPLNCDQVLRLIQLLTEPLTSLNWQEYWLYADLTLTTYM